MTRLTMLAAFALLIGWLIVRQPKIEIRLQRQDRGGSDAGAPGDAVDASNDAPA
jgi:hypothetical protein